jgi:hypothetical protein
VGDRFGLVVGFVQKNTCWPASSKNPITFIAKGTITMSIILSLFEQIAMVCAGKF